MRITCELKKQRRAPRIRDHVDRHGDEMRVVDEPQLRCAATTTAIAIGDLNQETLVNVLLFDR